MDCPQIGINRVSIQFSYFADRDIWVVLITSGLVAGMLLDDREIGKTTGVSMVVGYLIYMAIIL